MNVAPPIKNLTKSFNGHKVKQINQSNILQNANELLKDGDLYAFDYLRITKEKDIAQPEPTITIGGAAIASPGNITGISAAAKAGKTAIVCLMAAGAVSTDGNIDGFPEFKVLPNPERKAVLVLDTEQSPADQQYNVNTILKRACIEQTPDHFRAYNIRQLRIDEYREFTDSICELCSESFGGIHIIIIDGGADYILSVNDEAAAAQIVQYFIQLSIKYTCPVVVVLHVNPGGEKERGHFGSEIQRKCYGLLSLTRQGDISTLAPKIMRKAGNEDIPLINFKYSKEKGYHVPVDAPNDAEQKAVKERNRLQELAQSIFCPPNSFSHKESVSRIMQATNKGMTTAKTMLSNMDGFGYVVKGDDGNYRINLSKVNEGQNGSKPT